MEAVVRTGSIIHHVIAADQINPFSDFANMLRQQGGPFHRANLTMQRSIFRQSQQAGVRVMLDGMGGDTVISHGIDRLVDLAQREEWAEFGAEVVSRAKLGEADRRKMTRNRVTQHLSRLLAERRWAALGKAYVQIPWHTRYGFARFYADCGLEPLLRRVRRRLHEQKPGSDARDQAWPVISRDLAELAAARTVERPEPAGLEEQRLVHWRSLESGKIPLTLEEFSQVAAPCQVELRYPHFDKRLAEFCLGLPGEQKLWRGWNRVIGRRAMEGILPREIQWRNRKSDLNLAFDQTLRRHGQEDLEAAIVRMPPSAQPYFDLTALNEHYRLYMGGDVNQAVLMWTVACFVRWIESSVFAEGKAEELRGSLAVSERGG
jgi:asparagine synthase (glutamine-hydrolysing)